MPKPARTTEEQARFVAFAIVSMVCGLLILLALLAFWIAHAQRLAEAKQAKQHRVEIASYNKLLFTRSAGFVVLEVSDEGARVHDRVDTLTGQTGNDVFIVGLKNVLAERIYATQLVVRQEGEAIMAGGSRRIPLYRLLPADCIREWSDQHAKEAGSIDWRLF